MGRTKSLIEIGGVAMVTRAVEALVEAGAAPVVVVGGDRRDLESLGHQLVVDQWPGEGPLGGIITALDHLDTDLVATMPCDLIEASSLAVTSVVGAIGSGDVVVPVIDGHYQWLNAVWRRESCSTLRQAFDSGIRAPRHAVDRLSVVQLLDGDRCWYADADSPGDLPAGY